MPDDPTDAFVLGTAQDGGLCVMSSLCVPCEAGPGGRLAPAASVVAAARDWRGRIAHDFKIPTGRVLSGKSLLDAAMGPGTFDAWHDDPVAFERACGMFVAMVGGITFGGDRSIMSVATSHLADAKRGPPLWWLSCRGLYQRMQRQCYRRHRNGLLILPVGHDDCVALFGEARTKLNAGSCEGGWSTDTGRTKRVRNFPLSMFEADAVELDPADSLLVQAADLLAHAVLFRRERELGWLSGALKGSGIELAYDRLPAETLNTAASRADTQDAIVRNG